MAEDTLYGEIINQPNYGPGTSKEYVLKGIQEYMTPLLQKQRTGLAQRGFTGRYYSPTIESRAMQPTMSAGAEAVRKALTDLWYKEEELGLSKRQMTLQEKLGKEQIKASKTQRSGGKVLCTELYRQGYLPFSHLIADYKYLKRYVDKETHENYLRWAIPLVRKMRTSKTLTLIIVPFVRLWSGYMRSVVKGTRIPYTGFLVHKVGLCIGYLFKWAEKIKQRQLRAVV